MIADKVIGVVPSGTYDRGKRKGQTKYGFDVVSWWQSIQTGERMPQEEVERIILSRLPTEQLALPEPVPRNEADPKPEPCLVTPVVSGVGDEPRERGDVVRPKEVATGGLRRRTWSTMTRYWLGLDNPPGWFQKAVVVTARLLLKEGLSEAETVSLLQRYAREIPEAARHCSSRLASGDWASIDQDIAKMVSNVLANGRQADAERSDRNLPPRSPHGRDGVSGSRIRRPGAATHIKLTSR